MFFSVLQRKIENQLFVMFVMCIYLNCVISSVSIKITFLESLKFRKSLSFKNA